MRYKTQHVAERCTIAVAIQAGHNNVNGQRIRPPRHIGKEIPVELPLINHHNLIVAALHGMRDILEPLDTDGVT